MRRRARLVSLLGAMLALAISCNSPRPDPVVQDAWSRPTIAKWTEADTAAEKPSVPGVVYLQVKNRGREPDRLLRVRSAICSDPEIHETRFDGERARMMPVENGLEVPARGKLELRPGGYHLMLLGLHDHLREGDTFDVTLEFERSGPIVATIEVRGH